MWHGLGDAVSGREAGTSSWRPFSWALEFGAYPGLLGPEGFKLEGQDGIRVGGSGLVAVGRELGWQAGAVGRGDSSARANGEGMQGTGVRWPRGHASCFRSCEGCF